jgi:hypothetical protein
LQRDEDAQMQDHRSRFVGREGIPGFNGKGVEFEAGGVNLRIERGLRTSGEVDVFVDSNHPQGTD